MDLPKYLERHFWDVDFKKIDVDKKPFFVLLRIMEYGDKKSVSWMTKRFDKKLIETALTKFRGLSPQSANFWALLYNVDKKKVLCLNKQFIKRRKKLWRV